MTSTANRATRRKLNPDAVIAIRDLAGVAAATLAADVGISPSHMSNIDRGKQPSPPVIAKIAERLGVSIDAITDTIPQEPAPNVEPGSYCPTCGREVLDLPPAVEPLLKESDLAESFGLDEDAAQRLRLAKLGPPWVKVGRSVRYRATDVERWLDELKATLGATQPPAA